MDELIDTFNSSPRCTVMELISNDIRDYLPNLTSYFILSIYQRTMAFILKNTMPNIVKSRNVITPIISRAFAYRTLEVDPVTILEVCYRCRKLTIDNTPMHSGDSPRHPLLRLASLLLFVMEVRSSVIQFLIL